MPINGKTILFMRNPGCRLVAIAGLAAAGVTLAGCDGPPPTRTTTTEQTTIAPPSPMAPPGAATTTTTRRSITTTHE